jgi:hypothetical protein
LELPAYTAELTAADGNDAVDALSARLNELDRIVPIAHTLFSRFIDTIVQPSVVH